MKKYTKPMVKIVNIKSSEDIAASFSSIKEGMIKNYLLSDSTNYAVSAYSVATSDLQADS